MILSRVEIATLASLAVFGITSPAFSGDWSHDSGRNRHHHEQSVIGSNGLPSVVPGVGTFVGSISAVRIKGNGVFVAVDRASRPAVISYRAPKARIIEVAEDDADQACSLEAGVCVIRMKN